MLRREDPARWLPIALATLCSTVAAAAGGTIEPDELLEAWGLISPDEAAEINAERSIQNYRALAAQLSANHA